LNEETRWNVTFEYGYIGLIVSCSFIGAVISFAVFIIALGKKCKRKSNQVIPKSDENSGNHGNEINAMQIPAPISYSTKYES
jgi:hypothetical protein